MVLVVMIRAMPMRIIFDVLWPEITRFDALQDCFGIIAKLNAKMIDKVNLSNVIDLGIASSG
jgi:hypothetical protein